MQKEIQNSVLECFPLLLHVFLQQLTITKQYLFLKNNLKVTACFFFFLSQAESEINMISTLQARYRAGVFCLVFPYILASHVDTAYYITLKICAYVVTNLGSRKIFLAVYWITASIAKWSDFSSILPLTFNHFYFGEATQSCKQIPSCANIFHVEAHTIQVHSQWYKHLLHQSSVQIPAHSAIQISMQQNRSLFKELQDSQHICREVPEFFRKHLY